MMKTTGFYPRLNVDTTGRGAVGRTGGVLLTSTVRAAGLGVGLSAALAPWRPGNATHDPGKVLLDLAVVRAEPVNRPGFRGGSQPTEDESYGSTEEVSR